MPRAVSTPWQTCGPSAPTRQLSHHNPFKRPDSLFGRLRADAVPCLAACLCTCVPGSFAAWLFLPPPLQQQSTLAKGRFASSLHKPPASSSKCCNPRPTNLVRSPTLPVDQSLIKRTTSLAPGNPASDKTLSLKAARTLATQWSRPPWTGPGSGWPTHWLDGSSTTMSTRPDSATAAWRRLHPTNSAALAVTAGRPLLPGLKSSFTARACLHAARIRCVRRLVLAHERLRLQAGGARNAWPRRTTKPALPAHLPPTHEAYSLESAGRVPIKVIGLHRAS
ncbi:hypothetical protein EDB80DRAFT_210694 [Ilyonectria destructans]|nr:hypothetical protein EDB80DRAFT_210694 [Ilyonectria destructans]